MALDLVGDGMSSDFSSVIRGWLPASLPEHRMVGKGLGRFHNARNLHRNIS